MDRQIEYVGGEDAKAQLLRLRDLCDRTGILYEPLALQLRYWPLVLFTVTEADLSWDTAIRTVEYDLRLAKKMTPKALKEACAVLESWVQSLLGKSWQVVVRQRQKKGGTSKAIFRGQRHEQFDPVREPPGGDFKRYILKPEPLDEEELGPLTLKKKDKPDA